tara:strand:- start:306 stop:515 length:210 start_codon:yes stop_codon:yes gene_type:complete
MIEDKNQQFRGAGDVVEYITEISGIKYLMKRVYGKQDCGCSERQKKLNKMVPFNPEIDFSDLAIRIEES